MTALLPSLRDFEIVYFDDGFEGGEDGGVYGVGDVFAEDVEDVGFGHGAAVGAIGGEGFEHVGYGEDAGHVTEVVGHEAAVVAGAVELLVVGVGDVGDLAEGGDAGEDFVGVVGVHLDAGPL